MSIADGTASVARVWIYKNGTDDLPAPPGTPPGTYKCVGKKTGAGPHFTVPVLGCTLKKGHYWLAVQVAQDLDTQGQWYWATTDDRHRLDDAWGNPGDGWGTDCTIWDTVDTCVGYPYDFLFSIAKG